MSGTVLALAVVLLAWMALCAMCGLRWRPIVFLAALAGGLALNLAWMVLGLDAKPFEPHALMAQGALALYGIGSFGAGLLARRLVQAWRETAVGEPEV